jgi:hypothetical protein
MVGSCGVVRRERRRPAYPFVITIPTRSQKL